MSDRDRQFAFDVFLSSNAKDKPRVRRLAERLRDAGLRVWFDDSIVKPGHEIATRAAKALDQSRVLLLCISPNALSSGWVILERNTAVHRDPSDAERRFIPVLLVDCTLPDSLRGYAYVDLRKRTAKAFAALVAACRRGDATRRGTKTTQAFKKTGHDLGHLPRVPLPAILEHTMPGHRGMVRTMATSPNGQWAVSGAEDATVRLWDLTTGLCRATLQGHESSVRSVAISPDGQLIASGSADGLVSLWDTNTGKKTGELVHAAEYRRSASCPPNASSP